jgi:hypothetical protein
MGVVYACALSFMSKYLYQSCGPKPMTRVDINDNNQSSNKQEGLAMVYALQKFRHYLLGGHFKMFIDHSVLKYLVNKPVLGGRICIWLLLFQVYDFEIIVNP